MEAAYLLGGGMSLALLALRVAAAESDLFAHINARQHRAAHDLRLLLASPAACGVPALHADRPAGQPIWRG